jgi:hypothetical protein
VQAFPAGALFAVPAWPNVSVVNALGDYGLAADRLAFIDGDGEDGPIAWLMADGFQRIHGFRRLRTARTLKHGRIRCSGPSS